MHLRGVKVKLPDLLGRLEAIHNRHVYVKYHCIEKLDFVTQNNLKCLQAIFSSMNVEIRLKLRFITPK